MTQILEPILPNPEDLPIYSDGYKDINVKLLQFHKSPYKTFWEFYRMTWPQLHNQEFDEKNPAHIKACEEILSYRALPVPIETIECQFVIENVSRICMAQVTRQRIGAAFVVESGMGTHIDHAVTLPKNILLDEELAEKAKALTKASQEFYELAYSKNLPPQDIRYCLLEGQQVNLVMHTNVQALFGIFSRRVENGLCDELGVVFRMLLRELRKETKGILGWDKILDKFDAAGGSHVCKNFDAVFGNTGRSKSLSDEIPSLINEKNPCLYDFSKSALYYELLEMDESLLLPGEKEMINDWKSIGFEGRLRKVEGLDAV